ncbi:PH domain-containing protein [Lentzea sp. BCCO 10_0798]|uniref:PH domain-containing protein n=1 Tax=Lentzea kristufekii TaxID=3095430 RepID=A0ABU4TMD4_9PSEU|nr:PH domain-containing protein [Lentzea sp. BCCO 10_0798]MDX8049436.1 PH domain-containing protein [Lentzea sp. BCCO 10_0798]
MTRTWSTPAPLVATAWVAALALAVATFIADDNAGRLLIGLATLLVTGFAAFASIARPRLTADVDGLAVRGFTGTTLLPWHEVKVKLQTTRRLGREQQTLELDADDRLVVLTRLDLGADPEEVAGVLHALRP